NAADRLLKREGARVLAVGRHPGQLPMRADAALQLDRVWERGRVLEGYGRVLQALEALQLEVTGGAVLDARALGLALARSAAEVKCLPRTAADIRIKRIWYWVRRRIALKSWSHRIHALRFRDIKGNTLWHPDRIIPRIKVVASLLERSSSEVGP